MQGSVVGIRSLIGPDCVIEDSMIMGSDYYETLEVCSEISRALFLSNFRVLCLHVKNV